MRQPFASQCREPVASDPIRHGCGPGALCGSPIPPSSAPSRCPGRPAGHSVNRPGPKTPNRFPGPESPGLRRRPGCWRAGGKIEPEAPRSHVAAPRPARESRGEWLPPIGDSESRRSESPSRWRRGFHPAAPAAAPPPRTEGSPERNPANHLWPRSGAGKRGAGPGSGERDWQARQP